MNDKKIEMKKIEYSSGIKNMFVKSDRDGKYSELTKYQHCYARYFGCGNHLYLLTNEEAGEEALAICAKVKTNPRFMSPDLAKLLPDFRLVMVDVEMGGMGVWRE